MNKLSQFSRRSLFLPLLALMVASDGTAQIFESRIVFSSNRDGDWDIYSMDVNGNNVVQLTDHPAGDGYPACSPNGRRIAFISGRGITPDLYVMGSDGGNVLRLTQDNLFEARASWSPDGRRIAFSSFRWDVGNSEIYAMDADGENEINLTKHKWHDVTPSWSLDGSKIAFCSYRDGGFRTPRHIFVMNADGTGRRNLTRDTGLTTNEFPTCSPDGRKVAFQSQRFFRDGSRNDIFVITTDGKELEQLTDGPRDSRYPAYSPDGTKIAFASSRDEDAHIYLMDTNGRNAVKLTRSPPGADNSQPSWLPGALVVTPNGKLSTSWGEIKRKRNPW